jgi:endoglucanase
LPEEIYNLSGIFFLKQLNNIMHTNMRLIFTILLVFLVLPLGFSQKPENKGIIRVNQLGYYPKAVKKALIIESNASEFEIKTSTGKVVFKSKLSDFKYWDKSGENIKVADFSKFTKPGSYTLHVKDGFEPAKIEIKANIYKEAFKGVLKNFYFQRSGLEIEEKYAGKWARKIGHPDNVCIIHESAERGTGIIESRGGWYDAGDCNKYVVNAGVTVGTMLNFYEMYPGFVQDNFTNIPESGNQISDLLDEIKYELDWVLSMQTPDGASNMKITSRSFTSFINPVDDTTARFVVGKSTAPTLNLCGMTAQAARIFKNSDPKFADKCLTSAEKAWKWAVENPNIIFKNPKEIFTGYYTDNIFREEFWWAASELYLTTNKHEYLDYLMKNEPYLEMVTGESWRNFIGNLGSFSMILNDSKAPKELKLKLQNKLLYLADSLLSKTESNPYLIYLDQFLWGSNSDIENSAIIFAFAFKISGNKKFLNATVDAMDYIFGRNATGYSFVTGYGTKTPKNIHHRPSSADGIDEPVPGFVVGGPNQYLQDSEYAKYESKLPAKCYVDVEASYASNEVCLNWNAPALFVLGFLQANANKL